MEPDRSDGGGQGHARAARTLPAVQVHLTPYAPDCLHLQVDNPKRWRTFYAKSPEAVVRTLLTRLRRLPTDVWVRTDDAPLKDVDIMGKWEGADAPIATICEGLAGAEVTRILAELKAANWRPATVSAAAQ